MPGVGHFPRWRPTEVVDLIDDFITSQRAAEIEQPATRWSKVSAAASIARLATVTSTAGPISCRWCSHLFDAVIYTAVDAKPKSTQRRWLANIERQPSRGVCWSTTTPTTGHSCGGCGPTVSR